MSRNGKAPFPVYPQLQWNDRDYTKLKGSLHLYDDYIMLEKPEGESYIVDPADVASALANQPLTTGPLPPSCLFWQRAGGRERVGVYVEPQIGSVSVSQDPESWHIGLPGLVFIGREKQYSIYAVKGDEWPSADTQLYMAPMPNVGHGGVCQGTAPFPIAGKETIWQAVEVFFQSGFNRDLGQGKSRKYQYNILEAWKAYRGQESWPEDDLVETQFTLGRVIDNAT